MVIWDGQSTSIWPASTKLGNPQLYFCWAKRQSKVLGLGLKLRSSLRPPTVPQFDQQNQDFCRRVRLQDKFSKQPQSSDFNPRLYIPTGWIPLRENQILKTNSSRFAKTYKRASRLKNRTGETISRSKSEKTSTSWNPIMALKFCPWIKTLDQLFCQRIGFKRRDLDICMTSCHTAKSRNRTGMLIVLM